MLQHSGTYCTNQSQYSGICNLRKCLSIPPTLSRLRFLVLFRNEQALTYHYPGLLKRGVYRWYNLALATDIPGEFMSKLAPTRQAVYKRCAQEVLTVYSPSPASPEPRCLDLGRWGRPWGSRKLLLCLQLRGRVPEQQKCR